MLTAQAVADWLKDRGVDAPFHTDGTIPPGIPGRLVVVTKLGGPGESGERTRDTLSFQVRTRGNQNDPVSAEALAGQVDDVFMAAVPPVSIDGTRVISIQRQGGPPGFMLRDDARRGNFACSYLLETMRTTF